MTDKVDYKINDLVWAKMKGFSHWPGRISELPPALKKVQKKHIESECIFFFGSNNYAWVETHNIKPYHKFKDRMMKSNKTAAFKKAVEAIEACVKDSDSFESSENRYENNDATSDELSIDDMNGMAEQTPEIHVSNTLESENISPSNLTFGILGLGVIGCGIVKKLINSGHKVVVWNRTATKCHEFKAAGAEIEKTPRDVIDAADITFSCVADPKAAKEMVFGNYGVLSSEKLTDKGYVEMTGIDSETSKDIADAITNRMGRYLEAQIQRSKSQAEEGRLIVLAAGDRVLFEDCQTCFLAMGRNSFYMGDTGNASKMNLVLQMYAGVSLVAMAEAMALADRAGLQQKGVLEILEYTAMLSPMALEKAKAIIKGDFPKHMALSNMQKDLKLALIMADQLEQPLQVAATANEVYIQAKRLGYGDHDASAVYISYHPERDQEPPRKKSRLE